MTPHVTDDLGLYAAGLLDPAERAGVERHLDECAECRAALVREERTAWALAEAAARPAPRDLRARIVGAHAPRARWTLPRVAFALAAAVVLVVAAGLASGGRVVALDATGTSGRAALVTTPGGDGYLVLAMPSPPSGRAYEAWIIRGGQPLPAGLAAGNGVLTLRAGVLLRAGDVVAVTIEDAAGATAPTSDPILIGKL